MVQFKIQIAAVMQLDEPQSSIRYFIAASTILSVLIYLYFSAGPVQDDWRCRRSIYLSNISEIIRIGISFKFIAASRINSHPKCSYFDLYVFFCRMIDTVTVQSIYLQTFWKLSENAHAPLAATHASAWLWEFVKGAGMYPIFINEMRFWYLLRCCCVLIYFFLTGWAFWISVASLWTLCLLRFVRALRRDCVFHDEKQEMMFLETSGQKVEFFLEK